MSEPAETEPVVTEGDDIAQSGDRTTVRKRVAQSELTPPVRELHVRILRAFLRDGGPPTLSTLAEWSAELRVDAATALSELAQADLVHTEKGGDKIVTAYPFSGVSTDHVVTIPGGPSVYAMCAIDALGIPVMTSQDATITSKDAWTHEPLRVESHGESWSWQPSTTVVLSARVGDSEISAGCSCPFISFYASESNARTAMEQFDGSGKVLSQNEAVEAAISEFSGLLDSESGGQGGHEAR